MDPRRWRCGDRCATGERLRRSVDRGRDTPWTARGAAHRLPPPLPTDCLAFPTFPPLAACGRNRRRNFDFFPTPLRGCRPCALRLPPSLPDRTGGGAGEAGGTPQGCPRGVEGEPEGLTGGRHAPAPRGGQITPLWGAFWGGGGAARRVGEPPPGVPREAPVRDVPIDIKRQIFGENQESSLLSMA